MSTAPRPIRHIEIPSFDAKRTAHFYSALFGWKHGDLSSPYLTFSAGNVSGAYPSIGGGLRAVTDHFRAGDTVIYVGSDDLDADLRQAVELGGTVLLERTQVSDTHHVALIADPNGARVMLASGLKNAE